MTAKKTSDHLCLIDILIIRVSNTQSNGYFG